MLWKNEFILEFSRENSLRFGVEDFVVLKVDLKNVPTLIIKVFEINTFSYYKQIGNNEIDQY